MRFTLVVVLIKPTLTDGVVDAAKAAGAKGATIIPGHGTGAREAKTFFGLTLEAQTDVVLLLVSENLAAPVLEAVTLAGEFSKPGTGIAFSLPVQGVAGMESQLARLRREEQTE